MAGGSLGFISSSPDTNAFRVFTLRPIFFDTFAMFFFLCLKKVQKTCTVPRSWNFQKIRRIVIPEKEILKTSCFATVLGGAPVYPAPVQNGAAPGAHRRADGVVGAGGAAHPGELQAGPGP